MKSERQNRRIHLLLMIFAIILSISVVTFSCNKGSNEADNELSVAAVPLDLSVAQQRSDFKEYLEGTLILLQDNANADLFRGYDLSNFSDNDKQHVADRMVANHDFMKRLKGYQVIVKAIEKKYKASAFTKEQWDQIAKFGMSQGIYFLPGLKEKVKSMEEKTRASLQSDRNARTTLVDCCPCSARVEAANADLAVAIGGLSIYCLSLSSFPPAAAFCWAGAAAFYLYENERINSTEYWCDCMIEYYGGCVY
jgi:hypothetical protein